MDDGGLHNLLMLILKTASFSKVRILGEKIGKKQGVHILKEIGETYKVKTKIVAPSFSEGFVSPGKVGPVESGKLTTGQSD